MSNTEGLWPDTVVRWRCRRGLKELDIYFLGFFDRCFANMTDQERYALQFLLLQQDPTLQTWLVYEQVPDSIPQSAQALLHKMIADQHDHQNKPVQD